MDTTDTVITEATTPKQVTSSVTTESTTQAATERTTQPTITKLLGTSTLTTEEMDKTSLKITTNFVLEETTSEIDKPELQVTSQIVEATTEHAGTCSSELSSLCILKRQNQQKLFKM